MFKIPDWGTDIPKSDVEVSNLFSKKNKSRNVKINDNIKIKSNVTKKENIHKKKNNSDIKKGKNKVYNHKNISKDDYIKNRILKRNLKITCAGTKANNVTDRENVTGNVILNGNKCKIYPNNKVKNKTSKRNGKCPKVVPNFESNDAKKTYNMNAKGKKGSKDSMNSIDIEPKSIKRKHSHGLQKHGDIDVNNADILSLNSDEPDKILINAKRKKLNAKIQNDDIVDVLFGNEDTNENVELNNRNVVIPTKAYKGQKKKEKLKEILKRDSYRNVIKTNSNKLRERMLERLKAAQFRYLNEKLYTSSGSESQELFKSDPIAFHTYHEGYQLQVKKWPVNPLDLIVKRIQKMPKNYLIADMGCGEATLAKRVSQTVRSFDLVATIPEVGACNMAHTPLLTASMDAVVYCLALMGTDLTQYLREANRVLKIGGHLLIAEVESRFENVDLFSSEVQRLGFSLKKLDKTHQVFFFLEFTKVRDASAKRGKLPTLSLKPCLYKRR